MASTFWLTKFCTLFSWVDASFCASATVTLVPFFFAIA
jgi:hypothetical protein